MEGERGLDKYHELKKIIFIWEIIDWYCKIRSINCSSMDNFRRGIYKRRRLFFCEMLFWKCIPPGDCHLGCIVTLSIEVENSGKVRSAIRSEVEVLLFCMFWHELMEWTCLYEWIDAFKALIYDMNQIPAENLQYYAALWEMDVQKS